jgi:hypothetical protein
LILAALTACQTEPAKSTWTPPPGPDGKADSGNGDQDVSQIPATTLSSDDSQFFASLLETAGAPIDTSAPAGPARIAWASFAWDLITPPSSNGNLFNPRPARGKIEWNDTPGVIFGQNGWHDYAIPTGDPLRRDMDLLAYAGGVFVQRLDPGPTWCEQGECYAYNYTIEESSGIVTCSAGDGAASCTIRPYQGSWSLQAVQSVDGDHAVLFDLIANAGVPAQGMNYARSARLTFVGSPSFDDPQTGEIDTPDGAQKLADINSWLLEGIWGNVDTVAFDDDEAGQPTWATEGKVAAQITCSGYFGRLNCTYTPQPLTP